MAKPCLDLHQKVGYDLFYSKEICKHASERESKASQDETAKCIRRIQEVTDRYNLDPSMASVCFHIKEQNQTLQSLIENPDCLKRYDSILSPRFWLYEDLAVALKHTKDSDSFFQKFLKECKAQQHTGSTLNRDDKRPKIYSRTVFHTLTPSGDERFNVGGLSGLTIDSHGTLYAISDNRLVPNIAIFTLIAKPNSHKKMEVRLQSNKKLMGPSIDLEDIALDSDGRFIVTSEEIPGRTFDTGKNTETNNTETNIETNEKRPKDYIFRMDLAGHYLEDIKVPEGFYSRTLELDALCGKKEEPGLISLIKEFFTGSKRKRLARLSSQNKERCRNYSQAEGIRYNKGIESLALDPEKPVLYYMTEQALMRKNRVEKNIPLVIQDLTTDAFEIKDYPLDPSHGNGVVGLLKASKDSLLVLERGFDSVNDEAEVKLFKTNISGDGSDVLGKSLLVNFKDLLANMPPGLQKVDNFEGFTLGPVLENGNPTLIFVSDNNLSLKQKTDFIILEVPGSWLN